MKEWLGVQAYSFKDSMLVAAAAVASDLGISQRIAGHLSIASTRRYTKMTSLGDTLKVTAQLVVPGLHPRFGAYDNAQVPCN